MTNTNTTTTDTVATADTGTTAAATDPAADFDAQERRARSTLVSVQSDIDRAALAGNTQRLDELERERAEVTTQIDRIVAAKRGAALKSKEEAGIGRTAAASKADIAVKKLVIDRQAAVLNLGAALKTLGLAAAEVDAIDAELRAQMLWAVKANVSNSDLRQRLAISRNVGCQTVTPILAALHAATRAAIFQRRVEVGGFSTPAPDLSQAAARDTELTTGWLEALGRYRAIEEEAPHD